VAQRLALKEGMVGARLRELRQRRKDAEAKRRAAEDDGERTAAPALPRDKQLLEVLLAEPALVPQAAAELPADEVEHPGLRRLLEGLYALHAEGEPPELDQLRVRLDNGRLAA